MTILIINGPNLNMLGSRNSSQYGTSTWDDIAGMIDKKAQENGITLRYFQSNHEGALIDFLQKEARAAQGILINPGALTHYGYSLRDALADTGLPIVEVHMSDILNREAFRRIDVLDGIVKDRILGLKEQSYLIGLEKLLTYIT